MYKELKEVTPRWVLLQVFISGLVMGISPAPVNGWWIAWVALVPLWYGVHRTKGKHRQAFSLGLCWGIGFHGTALSWITGLHPLTWMGMSWLNSVLITAACWVMITLWGALIPALWAAVMAWVLPRQSLSGRLVIGATLWCLLEWIWTQSPLWWTTLAYTQSPANLVILHLGQLTGTAGITAAIVVVNGLIGESLRTTWTYRWRYWVWAAVLMVGLHGLGYGLYRVPLRQTTQDALQVGIVQGNVPTRIKLTAAGIRQGQEAYIEGYNQLVDQGVKAVLMPEGAFPTQWQSSIFAPHPMATAVQSRGAIAWLGTFMPQGEDITQSLVMLRPSGDIQARYNKIKLVPLGEYIPFRSVLGQLIGRLSTLSKAMVPGRAGQQFSTPWGQAVVGICFDSAFPHLFREQTVTGGEFILTASNNDPYSGRMMSQHHAHDVMRAIENDRWAVRATNTGYSGIVDPHGHTEWLSERRTYAVHAHQIYRRRSQTPYVIWGNSFLVLLVITSSVMLVSTPKRGKL